MKSFCRALHLSLFIEVFIKGFISGIADQGNSTADHIAILLLFKHLIR